MLIEDIGRELSICIYVCIYYNLNTVLKIIS